MAKINSPIGSRSYQSGMKEFVIDDETEGTVPSHEERQEVDYRSHLHQRQEKALHQQEKISDGAKKRIEILCGMTQLSKDVQVGDVSFSIKTLKNKDNRQSLSSAMKYDGTVEFPFEIRKQILARSIASVSGVEINMFLADDSLQAKLNFIDELDDFVAERLYQEYLNLNKEIKEKFSIRTQDDIAEMAEDLKK